MDMDTDSDEWASPPSPPTRKTPKRAAKAREPLRLTRSSAPNLRSGKADSRSKRASRAVMADQVNNVEDDSGTSEDDVTDRNYHVARKRRGDVSENLLPNKRPRRNPRRGQSSPKSSSKVPKRTRKPPATSSTQQHVPENTSRSLTGRWEELPYLVWVRIFDFVAAPIRDANARVEDMHHATDTLLKAARAWVNLTEPALTALYKCPPLTPGSTLGLSRRLLLPPEESSFNYLAKIKTLRIEVGDTLARKVYGHNVSLKDLIQSLPTLEDVELYHRLDKSARRNDLEAHIRWKYPDELFEALAFVPNAEFSSSGLATKSGPTFLKSWVWSERLAGESCSLDKLKKIHKTASFATLRKIAFINYQVPSLATKEIDNAKVMAMDMPAIQSLADAICTLPNLEQLTFEASTMVNGPLLELLPKHLRHLQLINCPDITADSLQEFLLTHGRSMQRLTLDHCRGLSLAFLPTLRDACPNLTDLSMDLLYKRFIESYDDNSPDYDVLLDKDQTPTWPMTLQCLNIQHMRFSNPDESQSHASIETASNFFRSLTDSASSLPNLRYLSLKAMIQVPWRARNEFRAKWQGKMEDVFKRPFVAPRSIQDVERPRLPVIDTENIDKPATPKRRSTRIAERPLTPDTPADELVVISERERANIRRIQKETLRLGISGRTYRGDDEDSEDELSVDPESPSAVSVFTQGLCDVVDIQIDDQRLAETQYTGADFMDSPPATDDDTDYMDD